ncbi:MAG: DUF4097 family beta strand repeat protein [Lachnospiraceae bacterium]|nr:DUF4097 family beta strand repeat protein [Lachnospiraceae bacterium]
MGKFAKRCAIFIAIFMIIGIALVVAGACLGFESIKKADYDGEYKLEKTQIEKFDSINIDINVSEIEILEGDAFALEYNVNGGEITYENKDGVLKITQKTKKDNFISRLFERENGGDIKIYIPKSASKEMKEILITNDVGDVSIFTDFEGKRIDIETNVGEIKLEAAILANIKVETNVGDVKLKIDADDKLYSLDLVTDIGDIDDGDMEWSSKDAMYTIEIDTNVGDIKVDVAKK